MTESLDSIAETESAELARRLRDQRTFLNLSQQFVSEQTGIPRSAISDIERGARRVESIELKRLAELYRMPVNYFLGQSAAEELDGALQDTTLKALARAASEMGEKEKDQVLRFALFLQNYKRRGRANK
jgi:transcriptional regulator with XRE-family HTH domain